MKFFTINLIISVLLLVSGFILPPTGIIDGSVLTAVGELLAFGVVAQLPQFLQSVRDGKSIKVQKGDFSAEVSAEKSEK